MGLHICDCHPRMRLPLSVSALLTQGRHKGTVQAAPYNYSTTTQSPDRQVKLAIAPTQAFLRGYVGLKSASCCIGYCVVTIPRQSSGSGSSGNAATFKF